MKRIALSLATVAVALLAIAAPAAAQSAYTSPTSGGAGAPESRDAGSTGGASVGMLEAEAKAEAEAEARRRAAAKRRAAVKRRAAAAKRRAAARRAAAAKRRAAARRAAARKRARARARARAKRQAKAPAAPVAPQDAAGHAFPIAGAYTIAGPGGGFGNDRGTHSHQGQDISAASGTPVVAPTAGTVRFVKYQAAGAGYYVVLAATGEDRDYVFMHLRKGSILVKPGDGVARGQQIAQVGSTGRSSGPHLHFEIWDGGWYVKGGKPVDPLPFLLAWRG